MRVKVLGAALVLCLAASAWADDVWKSKPYEQWDAKDVETVMRHAPWAKVNIQAAGTWKPADSTPMTRIHGLQGRTATRLM